VLGGHHSLLRWDVIACILSFYFNLSLALTQQKGSKRFFVISYHLFDALVYTRVTDETTKN